MTIETKAAMKPERLKLDSIQVARGVAALAVVGFHMLATQPKYFSGTDVLPGGLAFGMSGVDLFFVISGFVMVLTTRGRHGRPREVGKFAWNRFFRIYPTYWVYYLALLPVFFFLPGFINSSQGGKVDLFTSFFLLPSPTLPLLLVAWTLTIELWFYVVFSAILFLPERLILPAFGVWFVVLVVLNWNGPFGADPWSAVPGHAMAIEFIFGGLVALSFRRIPPLASLVLALGGIAVLATLGWATAVSVSAGAGLQRPFTLGVGYALLLLAATSFEYRRGIGLVAKLSFLGDMSYSVYLAHVLVLAVTGRAWLALSGALADNPFVVGAYWIFTVLVVLGVGYASYRLIERPVMKLSRTWRIKAFREKPHPVSADPAVPNDPVEPLAPEDATR